MSRWPMPRVLRSTKPAARESFPPASTHCAGLEFRFRVTTGFLFAASAFSATAPRVEAQFQSGSGLALRRTRLHQMLAGRASEVGVRLLWGTRVTAASELSSYRWIVGADGENSRVRRAAGLDAASRESLRFGFRRHYRVSPWTDFVEVHWGARCQVYVTPVSDDEIGIAVLSRDSHLRLDSALLEFPELQRRLQGADVSSTERGAVTISRRLRRVFRGAHGVDRRCVGFSGCDHRRRTEPLVSPGARAV